MALLVQKDVLWLEVSVDNTVGVEALQSQQDLSGVEAGSVFREPLFSAQMIKKFASVQKVDDKIELLGVLKSVMQSNDKGAPDFFKDKPLGLRIIFLISTENNIFF